MTASEDRREAPGEAQMRASADAVAGLERVRAQLARRTPAERAAFWEAVRRCFAGAAPET